MSSQDAKGSKNNQVGLATEGLLEVVASTKKVDTGKPVQKELWLEEVSMNCILNQKVLDGSHKKLFWSYLRKSEKP